jgi:hypothetical protein
MPNSRVIRPTLITDLELNRLEIGARHLYQLLWMHMDRRGVRLAAPRSIVSDCFPHDAKTRLSDVSRWLNALCKALFLVRFTHNGCEYLIDPRFNEHQKVHPKEPVLYKLPDAVISRVIRGWSEEITRRDRGYCIENTIHSNLTGDGAPHLASPKPVDNSLPSGGSTGMSEAEVQYLRQVQERARARQGLPTNEGVQVTTTVPAVEVAKVKQTLKASDGTVVLPKEKPIIVIRTKLELEAVSLGNGKKWKLKLV